MAWNGSGTFSRTNGTHTGSSTWVQDRDAGDYILASRHDTHDQDLADGIGACLTKNNESKPTAHFRPNADATYDLGSTSLQWKNAYLSGKILAGNGTAAAPSYSFGSTGNDDNGMYLSGNNTLAFATAGAKRLEIASDGNVGIGLTPSCKLHVGVDANSSQTVALFKNANTGASSVAEIAVDAGGRNVALSVNYTSALSQLTGNGITSHFSNFDTHIWRTNAFTQLMRLNSTGLGIGTNPAYQLHVGSGQIAAPDGSAAAPSYSFASSGNSDNGMYLSANNVVSIAIAGAKTLTVQADRLEFAAGYHVTSATATGATPAMQSGSYTPTGAAGTNVAAVIHENAIWCRVGNVVTVSGTIQIDPTSAGAFTLQSISKPISCGSATVVAGTAVSNQSPGGTYPQDCGVIEESSTSAVALRFYPVQASNGKFFYTYQYVVN